MIIRIGSCISSSPSPSSSSSPSNLRVVSYASNVDRNKIFADLKKIWLFDKIYQIQKSFTFEKKRFFVWQNILNAKQYFTLKTGNFLTKYISNAKYILPLKVGLIIWQNISNANTISHLKIGLIIWPNVYRNETNKKSPAAIWQCRTHWWSRGTLLPKAWEFDSHLSI